MLQPSLYTSYDYVFVLHKPGSNDAIQKLSATLYSDYIITTGYRAK